jgi:hypothetical protein
MKTTLSLVSILASSVLGFAQDGTYEAATEEYSTPVAYTSTVVYQAPVIYQAPVVYYAPVYYIASAATLAGYAAYENEASYAAPSTVIHITGGRGTYAYSSYGSSGSTVVYIGAREPRTPAYPRFSRRR